MVESLTPAELHIALALAEGPAHGYLLMQRVGEIGGAVGAATMYRTLRRMVDNRLVTQLPGDEQDERRRPYRLTDAGTAAIGAEGRRLSALVGAAVRRGVPGRFHSLTPQLTVRGADAAIAFYVKAFGARELTRRNHDDGRIAHAELSVGDSLLLVHDDFGDLDGPTAPTGDGSGVTIHLYVEDVDMVFARAVSAGGRIVLPIADQFWGDRYGILLDPFGHRWSIGVRMI